MIDLAPSIRSIDAIRNYAERLHKVDPKCAEPIPVTPEEAYVIQMSNSRAKKHDSVSILDMHILGHPLKIL